MLKFGATVFLLFINYTITAQVMEGVILDKETLNPVAGVNIINTHSGTIKLSDSEGHYSIQANAGDTLLFKHLSYRPYMEVMTFTFNSKYQSILLLPLTYNLKEAIIVNLTKYQQDSMARALIYHHELNRTLVPKPRYTGLGCAGCIGWLVDKITGNSKEAKHFRKNFAADNNNLFIDSRYTPELVAALTPLRDTDSIAAFIYKYPMEIDFARAATELELKAWIRYNYKDYIHSSGR